MPQQAGQLASKKAGKAAGTRKTDRQSRRKVQKRTKDEEFKTKTPIRAEICSSSRAEIAHTINTWAYMRFWKNENCPRSWKRKVRWRKIHSHLQRLMIYSSYFTSFDHWQSRTQRVCSTPELKFIRCGSWAGVDPQIKRVVPVRNARCRNHDDNAKASILLSKFRTSMQKKIRNIQNQEKGEKRTRRCVLREYCCFSRRFETSKNHPAIHSCPARKRAHRCRSSCKHVARSSRESRRWRQPDRR